MTGFARRPQIPFLVLLVVIAAAGLGTAADYCVAATGNDQHPGRAEKPFRTLQRGADALRPGDTCYVRGGVYRETVTLKASGAEGKPIRFLAMPGEVAVLSGAESIRGPWTVHQGQIRETTVKQRIRQLFVDGELMTEARWPNMPFAKRWERSVWRASAKGTKYGVMIDPALAKTGIDWTGAIATLNIGSWQTFRRVVRKHGKGNDRFFYGRDEKHRLAKERPHRPGFDRYFLAGKLEALDSPGEWFQDGSTLYLWAPDGKSPGAHNVEGKVRGYAVAAKGIRHVELSGFHFFATTFKLEDVRHCRVDGVHLAFPHGVHDPFGPPVGRTPLPEEPRRWNSRRWFRETSVVTPTYLGGEDNVLTHSSIRFANGTSMVVVGKRNRIDNCLVHDIDWYGLDTGLGVDLLGTADSSIRYCTIFNLGSSEGIRITNGGKTEVAWNYIHHGGLCQSDGGLVQSGTPNIAGTEVHHNWLHDHNAFNWGGIGIRGDDKTRGLIVHHNVAWRCPEKGIVTKGDRNRIYNNTCLDNPEIDICVPRDRLPGKTTELPVQNQHSETVNNCAPLISGYYPWQRKGRHNKRGLPLGKVASNYSGKEPMFVDAKRLDFRPCEGSPLIDAGEAIEGITDGYKGKAPDIGAYEFGAPRWVPGHRNLLWVLPGEPDLRVRLIMPTLDPVTVTVEGQRRPPFTLTFGPHDWARPRPVAAAGPIRFTIANVGFDETVDPGMLKRPEGRKLKFRSIP